MQVIITILIIAGIVMFLVPSLAVVRIVQPLNLKFRARKRLGTNTSDQSRNGSATL